LITTNYTDSVCCLFFGHQSAGTFEQMSGASSNYQADKPAAGSGNAGSIKARFEQMAKQGDEVWPTLHYYVFLLPRV